MKYSPQTHEFIVAVQEGVLKNPVQYTFITNMFNIYNETPNDGAIQTMLIYFSSIGGILPQQLSEIVVELFTVVGSPFTIFELPFQIEYLSKATTLVH